MASSIMQAALGSFEGHTSVMVILSWVKQVSCVLQECCEVIRLLAMQGWLTHTSKEKLELCVTCWQMAARGLGA